MSTGKTMGRPPKPEHERLSERLIAKVTPEEAAAVERRIPMLHTAAARASVASYLRMLVRADLQAHGMLPSVPYPTPPEPRVLMVAESPGSRYGAPPAATEEPPAPGERVVELDGEATAPGVPPTKSKRPRR